MRSYDTVEYASTRLIETIITHENIPILVTGVGGIDEKIELNAYELSDEDNTVKSYYLDDCDLNPVKLGYVNFKKGTHYLTRVPMRKDWRQGLRMNTILTAQGDKPAMIPYHVIANTIMGKFPSFKECLERLNQSKLKGVQSIAFCRNFSISKEELTWKGLFSVGSVNMENGNIHINDESSWVREDLDENLELVAA